MEIPADEPVSLCHLKQFTDGFNGPLIPDLRFLKNMKLLNGCVLAGGSQQCTAAADLWHGMGKQKTA
ncbi:hypothetical protein [Klebsiella pneumoniae]|nr:hypothetical protein [Klebsiella pneumoniae]KFJ78156.1 threonine--tRNA ligase [Klebsiella pneumoniae]MDP8008871.1 hypothetical protein [Klebsiella pneumoniae subsp. pneumoniae]MDP8022604.1 hypothetical protein [Klebsiella pneumoniae subsp. pneumoniae]MDQ1930173.1 hypothetical protein [Klebsiella pneumoniae subsp. pneumoniae]MDQ7171946.1 hypothetical protein [Klebsiella pneumoniae subsp. pneumoniae]